MEAFDRDPPVGTMHVLCCAGDLCNDIMPLPTLPEMPSGLVDLTTTTGKRRGARGVWEIMWFEIIARWCENTVEPLNKDTFGTSHFALCRDREVVLFQR